MFFFGKDCAFGNFFKYHYCCYVSLNIRNTKNLPWLTEIIQYYTGADVLDQFHEQFLIFFEVFVDFNIAGTELIMG